MFGLKTILKAMAKAGSRIWGAKHMPFKQPMRHMNFILIHYAYIIGISILGSLITLIGGIIAYGGRSPTRYIDLLFFSACAATQGGLNTVNLNTLLLWQQVVFYLISYLTNPIFINTCVVLIRLYWFEKRFQHVVYNARQNRRIRSRSRSIGPVKFTFPQLRSLSKSVDPETGSTNVSTTTGGQTQLTAAALEQFKISSNAPQTSGLAPIQEHRPSLDLPARKGDSSDSPSPVRPADAPGSPEGNYYLKMPHRLAAEQGTQPVKVPVAEAGSDRTLRDGAPATRERGRDNDTYESASISTVSDSSNVSPRAHSSDRRSLTNTVRNEDGFVPAPYHRTGTGNFGVSRYGDNRRPRLKLGPFAIPLPKFLVEKDWAKKKYNISYLTYAPTIARNSVFVDLTEEQREELGGIEYRSLKTLVWILIGYAVFFNFLGVISFLPWLATTASFRKIATSSGANISWWTFFTTGSLFNDVGFSLNPDSLISFQKSPLVMLLGAFLIIAGNTGFPCILRFIIWALSKVVAKDTPLYEELKFLLDHPRRCFTLLFPRAATWWLFFVLIALNGLDVILFLALDIHNAALSHLNAGYKVLVGIFQAAATRTAGFSAIPLASVSPAVQVSYMVMMYISIFPIAISIRRTNVYEERSLGLYPGALPHNLHTDKSGDGNDDDVDEGPDGGDENGAGAKPSKVDVESSTPSYIGAHLRRQLSFDLWYIFAGLFLLCISESKRIQDATDVGMNQFSILFEVVSAYGTVGMSLGYPDFDPSLTGQFSTFGKLVIIAMLIRGRHRGLPYALDRAILLPSDSVNRKDEEQARMIREATQNRAITAGDGTDLGRTTSVVTDGNGEVRSRASAAQQSVDGKHISFAPPPLRRPTGSSQIADSASLALPERTTSRSEGTTGKTIKRAVTALLGV